ncbi:hypothetical protein AcW1_007009 [Taiwanofungus camphoratus]|nr:hypothetical protein AcV5_002812 [Antrodia cinnamomea]KAI0929717.1 hypothetical protein AcV7_005185 [Antrodia cinnamomea]KAI0955415.1 hypothetical protein AcW1_007009 [Antrodia cinnamomea]
MKIGAFRAMPVNHLTDPVFRSEYRVELKLPTYSPESLTDAAAGTAMEFQKFENDVIRAYGVPKNLLVEFRVLSKPCSVIRDVTLTAIDTLDTAHDKPSRDSRLILTGPSGCGKSVLLLQAVEYCVLSNWIVLYIPRAISLVNSSTSFVYDDRTQTYLQPDYSFELLRRFLSVNSAALQTLTTQDELILEERSVPAGVTLAELVNAGLEDRASAPAVLSAFMSELSRQSAYPVLLAVDDAQALFCTTMYRDPHFRAIMSQHLSVPRILLEYASGHKSFLRGAFLGAESTSHTAFLMPLELREALGLPLMRPAGPYAKRSPELTKYAEGLQNLPVPAQLNVNEAASLFEVWMDDKALHSGETRRDDGELRSVPNDELFMTKYSEASGNARAFVWKGLLSTLGSL